MSDLLLEWMSFRREGGVKDLPPDLLGRRKPHRLLDELSMLGHIEMTDAESWQVAPPVLAETSRRVGDGIKAILCGARTHGLLERVAQAAGETGADLATENVAGSPAVIRLTAGSRAILARAATQVGIRFQQDAALALLGCSRPLSAWPRAACPMVSGKVDTVRRFSRSKLTWIECSLADAERASAGLFRIKRDWDWITIIKSSQSDCAQIDDRAGRLLVAARCRVLAWDAQERTLAFPLQLFPPSIVARALALCTGDLPAIRDRRIVFGGVTPAIVNLSLAVTGLRLV